MSKLDEIKERYGDDVDIIDMVHHFLTCENTDKQKERVEQGRLGKFYPSSIGRCKRAVVYQMLGYPTKPINGQSLLIMENGTGFHNRMEDIFEKMGILVAPELSLKDEELRISGRSDAIIWNFLKREDEQDDEEIVLFDPNDSEKEIYRGPANHILIVEFKSIKNKNYTKLPKSKPKTAHEMQLQLYFYLTGIKKGIVYYENKDNQESKHYVVEYDEQLINQVKTDIKEILDYADRRELPEKEGNALDVMCRYCDFRNLCHTPISEDQWIELYFNDSEAS
ncbi:Dna2/Cas4 domain-containing protein [Bacillus inaquosorum]|uniref:CRISPR-associated protein Cas4 n=1 Tax=Bacillus inaquosorum TaxID=483913 RepID=UPI00227E3A7B|nr:Dna2/Cas4 domain-containing protein [Bacillus inaquosorum]MCY9308831.1 Dna2/Cas4 domain-containing protein [Bacillus inaquosorum]